MHRELSVKLFPLFHRIRGDFAATQSIAYYLEFAVFHLPEAKIEAALHWLVDNHVTGQKFIDFIANECQNSGLELVRQLTMRIEKEKKPRRLFVVDMQ